jgi:CRP-like cAMP-binding protein
MEFEKTIEIINRLEFFKDFNSEEKRFFATLNSQHVTFEKNATVIRQGEIDSSLFILLCGRVKVVREPQSKTTLAELEPGAIFGEVSFLKKKPRLTSVIALEKVVALQVDGAMIERLNPILLNKFKNQLIELLLSRLDKMNEKFLLLNQ